MGNKHPTMTPYDIKELINLKTYKLEMAKIELKNAEFVVKTLEEALEVLRS